MDCNFGDCGGDCGDCGDCSGDCGCGDCVDCVTDCCDCNNIDCDCDNGSCRNLCQQCFSGPFENEARIRRFVAAMISLFLVVAQWLTSLNQLSAYQDNAYAMNNLKNLFNIGPINEIGLYLQCPTNTILFTNYTFPATIQGCYSTTYQTLSNTTCENSDTTWIYLGLKNQIETKYWGYQNTQLQYQLCGKRTTTTYKYLQEHKILKSTDCIEQNMKLCQDQVNDNNFYCVDKNEQCPIRNIKFDKTISENYEKVDQSVIEDQNLLITRNYSTFQYLMNFNISRGLGICLDREELASGLGIDYPLNKPQWTQCDLDGTFSSFLVLSTEAFININGLSEVFSSTRPLFNQTQNIALYQQNSIPTLNILQFTTLFDDFDTSVSYLRLIIYLSLAYWIYIVVLVINEIWRIIYKLSEAYGTNCKKCMTIWLFYIIRFLIQVPLIVLTQYGFFSMKACKNTIQQMRSVLITDHYSLNMLDFSSSIQQTVSQQYSILQGLVFTQLVIDIIVGVWAYYSDQKKNKYRRNNRYEIPKMVAMTYLAQSHQDHGSQY